MMLPYGSRLQPVQFCLARLFDAEVTAIPRLLACPFAPEGLKQFSIADQPRSIKARQADVSSAALYEFERYGCILLNRNPYHQPQIYSATARRLAA